MPAFLVVVMMIFHPEVMAWEAVKVQSTEAPSMESCTAYVESLETPSIIETEDGHQFVTIYECTKEI